MSIMTYLYVDYDARLWLHRQGRVLMHLSIALLYYNLTLKLSCVHIHRN